MNHPDRVPHLVSRLQGFGTSVFTVMTDLAVQHDAVNLGQGFPDADPPAEVVEAAHRALADGHHQYAPGAGLLELRAAVAEHQQRFHGLTYDPDTEVTITFGATEGLSAAVLALCEVGDEVVVLEPAYDAYPALISLAGAVERRVPLTPPDTEVVGQDGTLGAWTLDVDRLAAVLGPRTRVLVLNSPHNPTGAVFSADTLDAIAQLCVEHDVIAVTDEVYEHLVYDGEHLPLAGRPGMRDRTVSVSSAGKTFSCTGWKIGWACASPALTTALRTTKQFLSFAGGTPLQHALVTALRSPDRVFADVAADHRRRRDRLVDGLVGIGLHPTRSAGTYFVTADVAPLGQRDGEAFCRWAPGAIGVAAVPVSAFVRDVAPVRSLVRFAVCKSDEMLDEGVRRLGRLATPTSTPHRSGVHS